MHKIFSNINTVTNLHICTSPFKTKKNYHEKLTEIQQLLATIKNDRKPKIVIIETVLKIRNCIHTTSNSSV